MDLECYSHEQLIAFASLTQKDIERVNQCRAGYNRLGFAYQIGFVRLLNRFPIQHPFEILSDLLTFASVQLQIDPSVIIQYQRRQPTLSEHQERIRNYLKLSKFGPTQQDLLQRFVFEQSCRLEQTNALLIRACEFLRDNYILRPATSTLQRIIGEQRIEAQRHIFNQITDALGQGGDKKLDALLLVGDMGVSALQQLKDPSRIPSASAMKRLTDKLACICATSILDIDLSWLNNNYQRSLASYVRTCDAHRLREVEPYHRYGAIVCYLQQTYQDTIDLVIDMHDKLMNKVEKRAKTAFDEELKRQRKSITESLSMFQTVASIILDQKVTDESVREVVFSKVPEQVLAEQIKGIETFLSGKQSHVFKNVVSQFSYLRKFSPTMLAHLEFEKEQPTNTTLIDAAFLLKEMNAKGLRKLPEDAPTAFIPKKLRPLVQGDEGINKHAWECALLTKVRDEIKSGNLTVKHSKRFGPFDRFFISKDQWQSMREGFFRQSKLPASGKQATLYLKNRLALAYDRFLETVPQNAYAKIDGNRWHLSVDNPEPLNPTEEKKLEQLRNWIKAHQRCVKLPQLLIEVDNELNYTRHFLPLSLSTTRPTPEICAIIAAVMAHGCNIGPDTMAQLTPGVTYRQITRITDWQLTKETQRDALALVVNAIATLDTSKVWGEGKTSASDGQRFAFRSKVQWQTYSHKFRDFALEFYSFVADNYAPFYSIPIECNERDAPYVLDGLLYNESDMELEEHYTDTHGYTEINFAAFAMLGKRFCPRIRQLSKQRIYRIDTDYDYGVLQPLVNRRDRNLKMEWISHQWDRMGQFYATLQSGHTTASIALKRLYSMSRKNQFYCANRELGRIFKTEFILQYMSQLPLRRKIQRGLLKVDRLHRLAREVAYAKRGQFNKRDFVELMKTCSCLNLILACIVYWQAKEIERIITECNPKESGIDISLLEHISPIEWENVVLYGEYFIDQDWVQ